MSSGSAFLNKPDAPGMGTVMDYISVRTGTRTPIETLRIVFENNLMLIIRQFYVRAREYETGLEVSEYSVDVIAHARTDLLPHEYASWTQQMLEMKFDMLDRLNRWKEYLQLFDFIKASGDSVYVESYARSWIDPAWDEYVAYRVGDDIYMRFIYRLAWREKVIRRKWEKFTHGKPVEHIQRHQRDRLSEEEIIRRVEALFDWYNIRL